MDPNNKLNTNYCNLLDSIIEMEKSITEMEELANEGKRKELDSKISDFEKKTRELFYNDPNKNEILKNVKSFHTVLPFRKKLNKKIVDFILPFLTHQHNLIEKKINDLKIQVNIQPDKEEETKIAAISTRQRGGAVHDGPLGDTESYIDICTFIKKGLLSSEIDTVLQSIPEQFFAEKSQDRAKKIFSEVMLTLLDSSVDFPRPTEIGDPSQLRGKLDPKIFHLSATKGVQIDIPNSALDQDRLHVYQIASQYNGAESPAVFTPRIGEAMKTSKGDNTQGPLAQRTNPRAFEFVTAFLSHLGFNMMHEALPTAGSTYKEKSLIKHGYLIPTKDTIPTLTKEFKENYSKSEYVCYSSKNKSWGDAANPVYIFLQSAPAVGYSRMSSKETEELQKYAALANYLALFRYGIELAKKSKKPIVLHAAAVGGGVFNNESNNLQWGFEKAAIALQDQMRDHKVQVQLEAYKESGPMKVIADELNLPTDSRIGDSV